MLAIRSAKDRAAHARKETTDHENTTELKGSVMSKKIRGETEKKAHVPKGEGGEMKCSHCGGAHKSEDHPKSEGKKHEPKAEAKAHERKGEEKMEHRKEEKHGEGHKEHVRAGKVEGRKEERHEGGAREVHHHTHVHHHR